MSQEIERKFLIRAGGDYKSLSRGSSHIRQGYIKADGATVRVRLRDDRAFLTIKGPSADGGLSRYEFETEISPSDAAELLQLCRGGVVSKRRWLVDWCGHTFEVDEFEGDNEGLVVAEVELRRADEPFERPPFLGTEVTGDRRYYNSHLLRNPYRLWRGQEEGSKI